MDFEKMNEVAEWLGKSSDSVKLTKMQQLVENGQFFLTFWGHYSAGKPKLINSVLEREILPVQSRETTAVMTYIRYGEREYCRVFYEDGHDEEKEVNQVKNVFQNAETAEEIPLIDHIEVFLNSDLLRAGLVLVDTPGVNTVIQKHQDLAIDAIEQSGKIIYVLGNPLSNVDRSFIQKIDKCGIDIIFVRTKCDRIMKEEENPESALEQEKQILQEELNRDIIFIPVSSEKGNEWNDNLEEIRQKLLQIAENMSSEMRTAADERLKVYGNVYREELTQEKERLETFMDGNTEKIRGDINNCSRELERLQKLLNEADKQVERKVEKTKKEAEGEIDRIVTESIDQFGEMLAKINYSPEAAEAVCRAYDQRMTSVVEDIRDILNRYFNSIIMEEQNVIGNDVQQFGVITDPPTYMEIVQENSQLLDMYYSRFQEAKDELKRIIEEKQRANVEAHGMEESYDEEAYQTALAGLNDRMREIPSGIAMRLSDDQSIQPSEVFKRIGQAADIALLLLPGEAVVQGVKAAANTTKIAQVLHKAGKVGEVILKTGGTVVKNANAVDRVRDLAYSVNTVLGKRRYSTRKEKEQAKVLVDKAAQDMGNAYEQFKADKRSGNVLDALSVAFWTEKLGAAFDKPPKMELDTVEMENRRSARREIEAEQRRLSDERIQKLKQLGVIKTKEKELEAREKEQKITCERIEQEIRNQEEMLQNKSRTDALMKYKLDYINFYSQNVIEASNMLLKAYFRSAGQNITMYVAVQNSELMNRIEERKSKLEELLLMQKDGNASVKKRLDECIAYLRTMEEFVSE